MPPIHIVEAAPEEIVWVSKGDSERKASVLDHRDNEVYVHYLNTDKRMDEWVPKAHLRGLHTERQNHNSIPTASSSSALPVASGSGQRVEMTEEEYDLKHHKKITEHRNFEYVWFGGCMIKTWYYSPYPLTENEETLPLPSTTTHRAMSPSHTSAVKRPAVQKKRVLDYLAGGLSRSNGASKSNIWVCMYCFKYMTDAPSLEKHESECKQHEPPGRPVYKKGAYTIWEVDGRANKVYCQNLGLFGKLFIETKYVFFDTENFMYYIATDAKGSSHHTMTAFFSKEKVSFDNYNLACIVTLPQHQRRTWGMLLIEFSYELSRRSGQVGTPERPLSDLGLRGYLSFWVARLVRFLLRVMEALPPGMSLTPTVSGTLSPVTATSTPAPPDSSSASVSPTRQREKIKSKTKGYDGEAADADGSGEDADERVFKAELDTFLSRCPRTEGPIADHANSVVRCTLQDLADAVQLRVDDTAFALHEIGLLVRRLNTRKNTKGPIVLTRDVLLEVARERNIKPEPYLLRKHLIEENLG